MNIFKNGVGRPTNNVKRARAIIAVIAVILSVTIGYALFSQQVRVTGTATASGSFQITPTCYNTQLDSLSDSYEMYLHHLNFDWDINGSSSNTCTIVDNNHITYSSNLLYPGALSLFTVKFKNTGTMPAVFLTAEINYDNEYCEIENGVETCSPDGDIIDTNYEIVGYEDTVGNVYAWDGGYEGEAWEKISSIFVDVDNSDSGLKIEPNESIYVILHNRWDFNFGNKGGNTLNLKVKTTYEFPFKQYNE